MDILFKRILKKQDGFTLIEILIVIVILGIISSTVMTNASKLIASYKLESTAYQMISHLRYTQEASIYQDTTAKIVFNQVDFDKYYIQILDDRRYRTVKTVNLPIGVKLGQIKFGTQKQVFFTRQGQTMLNGHITLRNKQGEFLHVYVYNTGRFRISTV